MWAISLCEQAWMDELLQLKHHVRRHSNDLRPRLPTGPTHCDSPRILCPVDLEICAYAGQMNLTQNLSRAKSAKENLILCGFACFCGGNRYRERPRRQNGDGRSLKRIYSSRAEVVEAQRLYFLE
jgi:hypothetical protein